MQPNYHNERNFSKCDLMLIGDEQDANTYRYIQVQLSCILKSLISSFDSPSCVLVFLNLLMVGLEWVKKIKNIIESNRHPHVTTCHCAYSFFLYTIRSEKYDVYRHKKS